MAAETLREFLVKLGFVSDEPALRKFEDGISKATKAVVTLSAAVGGLATGVAVGVTKFAASLEGLYFGAQRLGTSATNLEAFRRAAMNVGVSADTAQGQLEAFVTTLATQGPAIQALLATTLATVGAKVGPDNLQNFLNLQKALAQMAKISPMFAAQRAAMFGETDYLTMRQLARPSVETDYARYRPQYSQADAVSAGGHRFMNQLRDLSVTLESLGLRLLDVLQNRFGVGIAALNDWLRKNGPHLVNQLVTGIKEFSNWIDQKAVPAVKAFVAEFDKWNAKTGGWLGNIVLIAAALKVFGGTAILGGVLSLTAQFVRLGVALATIEGGAAAAAAPLVALVGAAGVAFAAYKTYNKTQQNLREHGSIFSQDWLDLWSEAGQLGTGAGQAVARFFQPSEANQAAIAAARAQYQQTQGAQGLSADSTLGWLDRLGSAGSPWLPGANIAAARIQPSLGAPVQGASAASVTQNFGGVVIHIDGSQDPDATARAVKKIFSSATRYALPALQ